MTSKKTHIGLDGRAVAPLIAVVLLLGIATVAFSAYQVNTVPTQNSQSELQHTQSVQNDIVDVRNGILTAGQAQTPQFKSVTLGTEYPERLFAVNPPAATGTLQTSENHSITIEGDELDDSVQVETRFLEYQSNYHEIDDQSIWYENSVLYQDARDEGDGIVVLEDETMTTEEMTRITALQNEFSESGGERVALELYPTEDSDAVEVKDLEGDLTIELPTRLTDEYWGNELDDVFKEVDDDADAYEGYDEVNALRIDLSADDLRLNTVGIREEPAEGPVKDASSVRDSGGVNGNGDVQTGTITDANIDDIAIDGTRDQTFTFELSEERLPNGETVSIDLSSANEEIADQGGDGYEVAEVDSPTGQPDPDARFEEDGDKLVFEAVTGNVDPDDYTIEVSGIDMPDTDSFKGTEFEVEFKRNDSDDSDIGSFEIIDD